ncbi:MAG: aminotransferase class V-fold PLP-dependent enzyme [Oscillospiraceae bacterium]|nr:aminotransferase class V-fold PLP-dependent enzyme [Candidatus Ruminococcus equi]
MKQIYFDNAATSFPKAPKLAKTVGEFIDNASVNVGRGVYPLSVKSSQIVLETREMLCRFFDCGDVAKFSKRIIFTSGVTSSVNIFLRGLLQKGDHIVTGSMEHHCVMRTLFALQKERGITFDTAHANKLGIVEAKEIEKLIKPNTKAVIINHASNVFGSVSSIEEISKVCKKHNIFFAVDTAQTAGVIPISVSKSNIDFLAFSGHKGLLSLQGIGGFYVSERLEKVLVPTVTGGTGSFSQSFEQPSVLPDKYESGTLNLCGIYSLNHSLKYIEKVGIDNIREKEIFLRRRFIDGVKNILGITVYCADLSDDKCTAVVSISFDDLDNAFVANELYERYGIMVREGFHCAALAHKSMNTDIKGTVRFSFSYFNSEEEIRFAVEALKNIAKSQPQSF